MLGGGWSAFTTKVGHEEVVLGAGSCTVWEMVVLMIGGGGIRDQDTISQQEELGIRREGESADPMAPAHSRPPKF